MVLALLLPVTTLSEALLAATRGHADHAAHRRAGQGRPLGAAARRWSPSPSAGARWRCSPAPTRLPWAVSRAARPGGGSPGSRARCRAAEHPGPRAVARVLGRSPGPAAVNSLAALGLQRLDILLVTALAGPAAAAVYTAATRFLVVGQLGQRRRSRSAAQPRLAEVLAVEDRAAARPVYRVGDRPGSCC